MTPPVSTSPLIESTPDVALLPTAQLLPAADSRSTPPDSRLLEITDAEQFRRKFNHRPFLVSHNLEEHPLFDTTRLIELYRALPESQVEFTAGDIPVGQDPNRTPRNGMSVEETIQRIEQCSALIVLRNVEQDPAYAALVNGCLDEIQAYSEPLFPGMCRREGFIFISSPGALTHYHIDPEYNFLCQVRGQKHVAMFPAEDRELVTEQDLETFYTSDHKCPRLKDEHRDRAEMFELNPGQGLHFPVEAPHWVQNGPELSVSFSFTFRTDESERREVLYRMNHRLRRLGLSPSPVGKSKAIDGSKYALIRSARMLKRCLPGRR